MSEQVSPLVGTHTLNPTTDPVTLANRAECAATGHRPITFNPLHDATWCLCGAVVVAGNHGVTPKSRMPVGGWASLYR